MGRVRNLLDVLNLKTSEEIARFCSNSFREIQQIINGNISFQDNFRGKIFNVSFNVINADTKIPHNLGYVPTGYIVVKKSVSLDVYNGTLETDSQNIYLKSTVVGTSDILIY